jgi:hypothetical protein
VDPDWHEVMVNDNIDIFEMSHEESVPNFKRLEILEKIKRIKGQDPSSLPLKNKKSVIVTRSVDKPSKDSDIPYSMH